MRRELGVVLLAGVLAALTAACDAGGVPSSGAPGETSSLDTLPPIGESLEPEPTEGEDAALPGFEDWVTVRASAVQIAETQTGLGMSLLDQAQWAKADRGVLFHTTIDGDFRLSGIVRTTKTSDSSLPPGGDGSTQLGGLMARLGGDPESWLFLAVGADGPGLVVDVLATKDGQTSIDGTDWASGEAELKICRIGSRFELWRRPADTEEAWVAAGSMKRADLGGIVQVGAAMSADTEPDITALFDDLLLEPLEVGEPC